MAVNKYFNLYGVNNKNLNEQKLINDLTIECIQQNGVDCTYIIRDMIGVDDLFHEDNYSNFTASFKIEMMISNDSVSGFDGPGDVLADLGLSIQDHVTMTVSQQRIQSVIGKNPIEGDLIYLPVSKSIFEIKFVENEEQFYPLGTLTTYKLKCEKFEIESDVISTGDATIDGIASAASILDTTENTTIQNEGAAIIDTTETNPWGNF